MEESLSSGESRSHVSSYERKWDARSSIRTRPLKLIDFSIEGDFFPADKQPLFLNDYVKSLGEETKKKILTYSLFKYLNDITTLEIELINKACSLVLYSDLNVKFRPEHKTSAYTILIDEYYHVYLAQLMKEQLAARDHTLNQLTFPVSDSYHAVKTVSNELNDPYRNIFEVLAVCIFETTLVRELVEFFNSKDVHPSIKYYVNDHMNDESRHYGYFYELLEYTWNALSEDYKTTIGFKLARFVELYLNIESDKAFNLSVIQSLLSDENNAQLIINEIYKDFAVTPEIPIVKNVINVLKKTGIMSNLAVQSGFKSIGWQID